ncbi:MAG: hypothetical protein B6U97_00630 [Candidatus Altiarchaeales archaeon ex4484_96]|nr:MAG: hypothetical protein B6U97_00630 [Candidatus Altiarchaeales archaeon ex4484_96]
MLFGSMVYTVSAQSGLDDCLKTCKSSAGGEIIHLVRYTICIILRLVQLLCVIASVLAITLAGIMWISSDSSSQRALAKKIVMFALLGLIVTMIVIQLVNAFISFGIDTGKIFVIGCETTWDTTIYNPINTVACVLYRVLQLGAILLAAVVLTLAGIMWVGSDSPEDRIRARNIMVYVVIGFLVVNLVLLLLGSIIDSAIPYTFDCNLMANAPPGISDTITYVACIGLRLFQYSAILLAVAIVALSGVRFILSDSPEERIKARNMIAYTIVGFLVVFTAIAFINTALSGVVGTLSLNSIDCSITSSAPIDLENIRMTLHNVACIVIVIVYFVAAVLASLVIILSGIYFYSSDDPVARNRAKILAAQTVVGLIIILIAMNLISALFSGGGITSIEDATAAIFTNNCVAQIGAGTFSELLKVTDPINTVLCVIITLFQSLSALILVLVIMAAGFRWAISDSPEDRLQSKRMVVYGIIGILVILISTNIIYALISAVSGGVIDDTFIAPGMTGTQCQIASDELDDVLDIVKAFLCIILLGGFFLSGIIIALIIVYAGLRWIASDSPQDRNVAKWIIIKALIGYILIQVASQLVMALSTALVSGAFGMGGFFDFLGSLFGEPYIITCFYYLGAGGGTDAFIGLGILFAQLWFIFCYILRMLQIVAIAAAAIIIVVAGLKWIGSDSTEQRSYVKARVLHALIGLIIVILATSIVDALSLIALLSDMVDVIPIIGPLISGIFDSILVDFFHVDELYTNLCPGWVDILGIFFNEQLRLLACIIIRILQGVAAILATIVILLSGIAWMSSESYEGRTKARDRLLHAIIGLLIVMVALQLVNVFVVTGLDSALSLDCSGTDTGEVVTLANTLGCLMVKILESIAGMIAAILIIVAGYRWMTSESPEQRVKQRNRIITILVGLTVTIIALQLVQLFVSEHGFMQINPECIPLSIAPVDCSSPADELEEVVCTALYVGCLFIRVLMYIIAAVGLLMILWAGITWIVSDSPAQRTRARNMLISVIIALMVILLALALINYLVTGTRILSFYC